MLQSNIKKPKTKENHDKLAKYIASLKLPTRAYFPSLSNKQQELMNAKTPFGILLWACRHGEIEKVREILTQHPMLINYQVGFAGTPLCCASYMGHYNIVVALVEEFGANVNLGDIDGETPLHKAAYNSSVDIGAYLITKGANISAKSSTSSMSTPLRVAIFTLAANPGLHQMTFFRLLASQGAMREESLEEHIFGKTMKEYIRAYVAGPQMLSVLQILGLEVDQGVEVLCQALTGINLQSDPNIDALIAAFNPSVSNTSNVLKM